jgi:hypothetical protein
MRDAVRTGGKSCVFDNAYGQAKPKLLDPAP